VKVLCADHPLIVRDIDKQMGVGARVHWHEEGLMTGISTQVI
jgi:hypothetical protein